MTGARSHDFFETVASAGVYPTDMDYKAAFTLQFVNKKVGLEP
jgi:NitT/TauT family transport system substrate-binding protein